MEVIQAIFFSEPPKLVPISFGQDIFDEGTSAQILCSSNKGYVAYGAKNNIVVLKCKPQNHFTELKNVEKNEGEDQGKHYQ